MIRFTPSSNKDPKPGQVLLSEPFLDDAYFGRKAVLLCEHNEESSFGFVLNNFVDIELSHLLQTMPEWPARISLGGPVKNSNLYYLHTCPQIPGAVRIHEDLYMGGEFDWVKQAIIDKTISDLDLRFFVGYAGWTAGQLTDEMKSNSWFIADVELSKIMDTTIGEEDYWKQLIMGMGDDFAHIANAPSDPSLN
jgi:putative transcriptional regulator